MTIWDFIWPGWLVFLAVADFIANKKPGATFSEHARIWFKTKIAAIILAFFLIALYLHLVPVFGHYLPVWPIIVLGSGISVFIARNGKMFRWDKWVEGLVVSGVVSVIAMIGPIISDGNISPTEWYMLLTSFIGGVALYLKQHPPVLDPPTPPSK